MYSSAYIILNGEANTKEGRAMKLDEVRLKNFRAYRDEISVPMSALTAFIGKNDIGKSSVLEALEIFFNSDQVVCERDDLSVCPQGTDIEITCTFSNLPSEIVLDSTAKTSLEAEYLLNADGKLEIKKVYACTAAKPKEKYLSYVLIQVLPM